MLVVGPAYVDITASLVACLFLLYAATHHNWEFLNNKWVRYGLAFWAIKVASVLWAYDKSSALVSAVGWGRFLFFGIAMAYWVLPNRSFAQKFFILVVLCLAFLSIDGVYQYYAGVDLFGHKKFANTVILSPDHQVGDRLTGPYSKAILGATVANLLFPVLLCALYALRRSQSLFLGLIAVLAAYTVILSGERSQMLLVCLGGVLTSIHIYRQKKMKSLIVVVPCVLGALFFVQVFLLDKYSPALPDYIKNRQIQSTWAVISDFTHSSYGRIWMDALRLAKHHPILGVGEENVRVYWCQLGERRFYTEGCPLHPHNVYLEVLTSTGLVGLFLYLLTLFSLLRYFYARYPIWRHDPLITGICIAALIRMWPLIAVTSYDRAISSLPFWLMVGWAVALIDCKSSENEATA